MSLLLVLWNACKNWNTTHLAVATNLKPMEKILLTWVEEVRQQLNYITTTTLKIKTIIIINNTIIINCIIINHNNKNNNKEPN